jgi:SAM-dependent methyltransferase
MTIDSQQQPWEHPDWYDLHDNTDTAGPEREPEHYREFVLTLPPLDHADHLVDLGAGTGKLAQLIAKGYPRLGQITLIEPNSAKLERAAARLRATVPTAQIAPIALRMGDDQPLPTLNATLVTVGSVLMPIMAARGGTLTDGLGWLRRSLCEAYALVTPGGWFYDLETLAVPWEQGGLHDPVRRLHLLELTEECWRAGFTEVECLYRFRDRVVVRGRKAPSSSAAADAAPELRHA